MTNRIFDGRYRVFSTVLSIVLFVPALARAQEPAHTLQALQSTLNPGDDVKLSGTDGKNVAGKVVRITGSSLQLKVKGVSREFQEPQILEVRARYNDPIGNGVKWGALIGGVSGAIVGAVVSDAFCDGCGNNQGGGALAFGFLGLGIGAGAGAMGDSLLKGYTPVFKMQKVAEKGFGVSPLLSKKTKGVAVAFRF